MSTPDAIGDVIDGILMDFEASPRSDPRTSDERLKAAYDELVILRTQLRDRGDDSPMADPIENLALALYRADHLINREMTPPNWSFIDEDVKKGWRKAALGILADL